MKVIKALLIFLLVYLSFSARLEAAFFKYGANPVLNLGTDNDWDSNRVWDPSIMLENNIFRMWYTGYGNKMQIGYGESNDPINFSKYTNNPIINWDIIDQTAYGVGGPSVLNINGTYKMWFVNASSNLQVFRVYYSESTDRLNWSQPTLISFNLNNTTWDSQSTQIA